MVHVIINDFHFFYKHKPEKDWENPADVKNQMNLIWLRNISLYYLLVIYVSLYCVYAGRGENFYTYMWQFESNWKSVFWNRIKIAAMYKSNFYSSNCTFYKYRIF